MQKKKYNTAPLPFQGQKRRFLNEFRALLKGYDDGAVFIDLFGGSGLLAHTAKAEKPFSTVIYNDFDNYFERIKNIDKTNSLLSSIRPILKGLPKDKKLPDNIKNEILDIVYQDEITGFVDYITLSSSLLFSANYVTDFKGLEKATFYNVIKQNDYNAKDYLDGVQRVQMDYKELYQQYKDNSQVVWLVDPPYLSTDSSSYRSDGYWKLKDYLDVLQVLKDQPYVYFTSNKSSIVELCEWIATIVPDANPFAEANLKTVSVQMNYNSTYTDMMYYKYYTST